MTCLDLVVSFRLWRRSPFVRGSLFVVGFSLARPAPASQLCACPSCFVLLVRPARPAPRRPASFLISAVRNPNGQARMRPCVCVVWLPDVLRHPPDSAAAGARVRNVRVKVDLDLCVCVLFWWAMSGGAMEFLHIFGILPCFGGTGINRNDRDCARCIVSHRCCFLPGREQSRFRQVSAASPC